MSEYIIESKSTMINILDKVTEKCAWDCVIAKYEGDELFLTSGTSIDNTSHLAILAGVSYIDCAFEFSHPVFREATNEELVKISKKVPIESTDIVIAIEAETMAGLTSQTFYIVAESISIFKQAK